jgi:low temperature requirement protein LtrA
MRLLTDNFRLWWQVPRRAGDDAHDRTVTFLELFYDLVYVVLIAQFSHQLSNNISWEGVGEFVFLFIIVWWAWFNGTIYHDLHGNNDIRTRTFTFLQMFAVIAMAIFAHDAIGHNANGFALAYAFFQIILTYLWWRTGVHDKDHRSLSRPYSFLFLINTLLFIASVFIYEAYKYYMWFAAIAISIVLPLLPLKLAKKNPSIEYQIETMSRINPSLVERFGLFTIIVLGEVVVGIVAGVTHVHHLNWEVGITAFFGSLIAIGLWWLYFDYISHKLPRKGVQQFTIWYYLHVPVVLGITMTGAALLNIFEYFETNQLAPNKVLLLGSISTVLFGITLLGMVIRHPDSHKVILKWSNRIMPVTALVVVGLIFINLSVLVLITLVACIMLIPVLNAIIVWIRSTSISNSQ